jgi:PKD repeat protein
MRNKLILFILVALFLVGPTLVLAGWDSATGDSRYRIERTSDSNEEADAGFFLLWPNDLAASNVCLQVFSTNGSPVGYEVLWAAEGEPLKVFFNSSAHDSAYYVYTGKSPPLNTPAWNPTSGLILETREREEGDPRNATEIRRICNASSTVLGRSLLPNIFHGINPHGPTDDFVSIITGFFSVETAGSYDFATVSEDASCLLVDRKVVAEWPGWHDCNGGRKGQHHGAIKLNTGRHRIEYLNVKKGFGYTVEAAWRQPGQDRFEIMPASAFAPVGTFEVSSYEPAPSKPIGARFTWDITAHFTIDVATFVHVRFKALNEGQSYTWNFDDGTSADGPVAEHVFLSTGMRTVKLEVQSNGVSSSVSQKVLVHPMWTQQKEHPRHLFKEERRKLAEEDFHSAPVADLVNVYRIAVGEEDLHVAKKFAALCLQRKADFDAEYSGVFSEIALFVQRPDIREYGMAEEAFRIVMESPLFKPDRKAWAALHLSGMLIHYVGRVEDAQNLLAAIESEKLSDSDRRLKKIYEADVLFALGHLDSARQMFASIDTSHASGDTGQILKRQARIETARDCLKRGDFDDSEQMVRSIEWDAPEQRMATETGLIMIRVCIGRNELQRAVLLSRKLLTVAETDFHKSEILSAIVEISVAMKRDSEAASAYRQLLKDYPYSEAAARAKEEWGGRIAADKK